MTHRPIIEKIIYLLLVVLALATLWLVFNAPESFLKARAVYQGF